MKRYCLKSKAKTEMIAGLISIGGFITLMLFIVGIVALPLSLTVAPENIAELIASYIGILSWTAVFSFIAIGIKRWLQSNIMEC